MGTKHPGNAKRGCRLCNIIGLQDHKNKYYYPHQTSLFPRVHQNLRPEIEHVVRQKDNVTKAQYSILSRESGINRRSILLDIPTIHFPRSFPIDTMHSVNHNIPKHFMMLWKGLKFPQQDKEWELSKSHWHAINTGLAKSRMHVPIHIATAPRTTNTFRNWTADEFRSFFTTYGAPALATNLTQAYGANFLRYQQIMTMVGWRHFLQEDVCEMEALCRDFVQDFESIYYQGSQRQLKVCTIQIHYLLHICANIRDFGSPIYYAQWSLERFLRSLKNLARSNSRKYASLTANLIVLERINHATWARSLEPLDVGQEDINRPFLRKPMEQPLDARWQRKLNRSLVSDDWNTPTVAYNMEVYQECRLPCGAIVCPDVHLNSSQREERRSRAYVYYNSWGRLGPEFAFGMVIHLIKDPHNGEEWPGLIQWHNVEKPICPGQIPRPRRCSGIRTTIRDQDERAYRWIRVQDIVGLVGVAVTYTVRPDRQRLLPVTYIVDKDGVIERPDMSDEELL